MACVTPVLSANLQSLDMELVIAEGLSFLPKSHGQELAMRRSVNGAKNTYSRRQRRLVAAAGLLPE
jgi:hypothetical protein